MNSQTFREIEEYCPRCNEREISHDGVCRNCKCKFKCWYTYH